MADNKSSKSKRLFINYVDLYTGSNLAKFLSNCVVGASQEEEEEEEADADVLKKKEGCYQIHATAKDKNFKKPNFVNEIYQFDTREQMFEHLIECDVIVYDITEDPDQIDEAIWALSEIHAELDKIESPKIFILLSNIMTWAKSKPLDPEDPEIPFTEEDYRRRKPHPNFKEHINAEKHVIKLGKTNKAKLATYVVASGLTYGAGENIFHYFFKSAWHNTPDLKVFGNGENILPTIHIKDLAAVIQNVADARPKTKYIVAVDDSKNTLSEIVKAISQKLTTGKIKSITKEEALLNRELKQSEFDQLLLDLRMDGVQIKESMKINWVAETGIVENIDKIVKDFKQSRGLVPLRACVLGPPASGKTTLVKELAAHYKLHHIKIKDVIDEAIASLERSAARVDAEEEEDDDGKAAEDAETLEQVKENMAEFNGRLDQQYITKFFREKLLSKPCQNQGFILDGYPKTKDQADELFAPGEDDEEEEEEAEAEDDKMPPFNKRMMPEYLFVLEADDNFLKHRVMHLSEAEVAGTHNTEEGLVRRLSEYRAINGDEESVVNFFDEREIHPIYLDVTKDSKVMTEAQKRIKKEMGAARNYGPQEAELLEIRRKEEAERLEREMQERAEKERIEAEEAADRKKKQEEWASRLEEVKREEQELLEAQSLPLRNYLMKHVMPVLTEGLMDCVKVRPDDAIDYLAEYLFRQNPQVD